MKMNLPISLLLCSALLSVKAQDFRAVPSAKQTNAVELAYFDGKNPNLSVTTASDSGDVALVTGFLDDLTKGQFETAHKRLADGFATYGPGYNDRLGTDNLLEQWNRNGQRFTNQQLTIETTSTTLVPSGNNQWQWVYVISWPASITVELSAPTQVTVSIRSSTTASAARLGFHYTLVLPARHNVGKHA